MHRAAQRGQPVQVVSDCSRRHVPRGAAAAGPLRLPALRRSRRCRSVSGKGFTWAWTCIRTPTAPLKSNVLLPMHCNRSLRAWGRLTGRAQQRHSLQALYAQLRIRVHSGCAGAAPGHAEGTGHAALQAALACRPQRVRAGGGAGGGRRARRRPAAWRGAWRAADVVGFQTPNWVPLLLPAALERCCAGTGQSAPTVIALPTEGAAGLRRLRRPNVGGVYRSLAAGGLAAPDDQRAHNQWSLAMVRRLATPASRKQPKQMFIDLAT